MPERRKRIHMLDEIRGFAIICMIFHHAFLDVGDVIGLEWGYEIFDALCTVQPIFWTIFIVISGMCSRLSRNTVKRGILVLVCAGIITLATAVIMPLLGFVGAEIYFGILHCLGTCMVITGLLMPLFKKIDFRIGAAVSLILFLFVYGIGFHNASFHSADYFSILPWIFMFFFGAFIGKIAADEKLPEPMYKQHSKFLSFVGKNSLWVYLAHQPILYAVMFIIAILTI